METYSQLAERWHLEDLYASWEEDALAEIDRMDKLQRQIDGLEKAGLQKKTPRDQNRLICGTGNEESVTT